VNIPVQFKIKNLTEKYVLREAARPVLTQTVYERQKHPFLAPPVAGQMDGKLFQLMQDTLRSKKLADVPFYDAGAVTQLLDRIPDLDLGTRSTLDPLLMSILSICSLQERFGLSI
jgi:asparagine synthase (glutamine-hydrolysing)